MFIAPVAALSSHLPSSGGISGSSGLLPSPDVDAIAQQHYDNLKKSELSSIKLERSNFQEGRNFSFQERLQRSIINQNNSTHNTGHIFFFSS